MEEPISSSGNPVLSSLRGLVRKLAAFDSRSEGARRVALLVAILLVLGYFKLEASQNMRLPRVDGGYYTDIARHVRDGDGLTTDISLYHKAYSYFPHPTAVSPLWPLLYGYSARLIPLLDAGIWIPSALYMLSLVFAYLWGVSLFPEPLFRRSFPGFDAGHVAVIMLGVHAQYFEFTSLPYTEALAYTLTFAALWRSCRIWKNPSLRTGLELGAWLGLTMLARSQLFILTLAAASTFIAAIALFGERRKYLVMLAACALTFLALIAPHYWFISTFVEDPSPLSLLRFDQLRESQVLSEHFVFDTTSLADYLIECVDGIFVAFKLDDLHAYHQVFHLFQYSVIAAVPFLIAGGVISLRREGTRAVTAWLRSPASIGWIFVVLVALAGFFSLHVIHKTYYHEWNFARRQGLTAMFIFFLALIYLLRNRRFPAVVIGVFLLGSSAFLGYRAMDRTVVTAEEKSVTTPENYKSDLVAWLNAEASRRGGITVAMSAQHPQRLAFLTTNVYYHWVYKTTELVDIERLVDDLGVDYLVLSGRTKSWSFREDEERFSAAYEQVGEKLSGFTIYAPAKPKDRPRPEPST